MADDLSITVQGTQALVAKLGKAAAFQTLRPPMERSTARLQRDLAQYPSPPAGSTYQRTGNLGRAWKTRVGQLGGTLEGTIGNAVRSRRGRAYAPYVQGSGTQASMHQGRWLTDAQAVEKNRAAIAEDFTQAIDQALK